MTNARIALEQLELLSEERFLELYSGLTRDGFGPLDADVARALNFRPQAVQKLPLAQRARRARALILRGTQAEMAYELIGAWLLRNKKEIVTGFLDATGVPHEDGMISDLANASPDRARITAAIAGLDAAHPPEQVTLYLAICAQNWPEITELETAWRARAGARSRDRGP